MTSLPPGGLLPPFKMCFNGSEQCCDETHTLTALDGLVRTVAAVLIVVTHKVFGDALLITAHELFGVARVTEDWRGRNTPVTLAKIPR